MVKIVHMEETNISLRKWRKVRETQIGSWQKENLKNVFKGWEPDLEKSSYYEGDNIFHKCYSYKEYECTFIYEYFLAQLQDNWEMTVNYKQGQIISFCEKKTEDMEELDFFHQCYFAKRRAIKADSISVLMRVCGAEHLHQTTLLLYGC